MNLREFSLLSDIDRQLYLSSKNYGAGTAGQKDRRVCGIGVNDSRYPTQPRIGGKQVCCPAYRCWRGMLTRCYNQGYQRDNPTYVGASVCVEWLRFSTFLNWWKANQVDGWDLDKDLLSDSKMYSPDTCVFVPKWLNRFTLGSEAIRGTSPIGTSLHRRTGKYVAYCKNPITGSREHLGSFESGDEAWEAWSERKLELADLLKGDMDKIDSRIYGRVVGWIEASRLEVVEEEEVAPTE